MTQPIVISQQLPFDVRMALVRAAATPNTRADPMARLKAIEAVVERSRISHPYLLKA